MENYDSIAKAREKASVILVSEPRIAYLAETLTEELCEQLIHVLCEEAWKARFVDIFRYREFTEQALRVTEHLSATRQANDLRALANSYHANGLKIAGRYAGAQTHLEIAEEWRHSGTGDPALHSKMLEIRSRQLLASDNFEASISLLDRAIGIATASGDLPFASLLRAQKAVDVLGHLPTSSPEALFEFAKGEIRDLHPETPPWSRDILMANLAALEVETPSPNLAYVSRHLALLEKRFDEHPLLEIPFSRIKARLFLNTGQPESAAPLVSRALALAARFGHVEQFLGCLSDTAWLEILRANWSTAKKVSAEVAALASQLQISPEHQDAVELWIAAAQGERLDAAVLNTVYEITKPPRLS